MKNIHVRTGLGAFLVIFATFVHRSCAVPAPGPASEILERQITPIRHATICNGPNLTGFCVTTPATPSGLECIDFSGPNQPLENNVQSLECVPGFACMLSTVHSCNPNGALEEFIASLTPGEIFNINNDPHIVYESFRLIN